MGGIIRRVHCKMKITPIGLFVQLMYRFLRLQLQV